MKIRPEKRRYIYGLERSVIWKEKGPFCKKCGKETVLFKCFLRNSIHENRSVCHIDHIIPLSKGGSCSIDNYQVLCEYCNLSKGGKDD